MDEDTDCGCESPCKIIAIKNAMMCVNHILNLYYDKNEQSSFRIYQYFSKVKIQLELL